MRPPTWLLLVEIKALVMSMPLERFLSTFFASRGFWNNFRHPSLYREYSHLEKDLPRPHNRQTPCRKLRCSASRADCRCSMIQHQGSDNTSSEEGGHTFE